MKTGTMTPVGLLVLRRSSQVKEKPACFGGHNEPNGDLADFADFEDDNWDDDEDDEDDDFDDDFDDEDDDEDFDDEDEGW